MPAAPEFSAQFANVDAVVFGTHADAYSAVFELLMQQSAPWFRHTQADEIGEQALMEQILQRHPSLFARLSPNADTNPDQCAPQVGNEIRRCG